MTKLSKKWESLVRKVLGKRNMRLLQKDPIDNIFWTIKGIILDLKSNERRKS